MTSRFRLELWASWLGVIVLLLVWQLLASLGIFSPSIFPGPLAVLEAAIARVPLDELFLHVRTSLTRVVLGFSLGAGLGIVVGVAAGWYRWLGKIVWSPIELLRPIPPLAWIPIALIWFGLGEPSKVFIIFLGAFFPVVTNAYKGMTTIEPALLRVGQTMGLRGWRLLARVALPASLPDVATGLRVGWSLAFGSLVAAEILAASEGLGFLIMYARELGETAVIVYGIIIIGLLNLLTDYLIYELFLRRRLRWYHGAAT